MSERVGLSTVASGESRGAAVYNDVPRLQDAIVKAARGLVDARDPFAALVPEGASVLLKPNWVTDRNRGGGGTACLVTHPNFVEATLREVLRTHPRRVIIGDAPIQSANFARIVDPSWAARMRELGSRQGIEVSVDDFRNVITRRASGRLVRIAAHRRDGRLVMFDLRSDSALEPISRSACRFRITSYDPERLRQSQGSGMHRYAICREALEADVVINLAKLKCHSKAGITGALKNLVGINGDKDCLPHHRSGSPENGGDCYDRRNPIKRTAELLLDVANHRIGRPGERVTALLAAVGARAARDIGRGGLEGAWYGNDTVWRMALDLDRIVAYGRISGEMAEMPQRRIVTITDALIAGEGEGPLAPTPVELGIVTCSISVAHADLLHASLMGFDWQAIPLVRHAFDPMRWPTASCAASDCHVVFEAQHLSITEAVARFGREFQPASGWCGHVERRAS